MTGPSSTQPSAPVCFAHPRWPSRAHPSVSERESISGVNSRLLSAAMFEQAHDQDGLEIAMDFGGPESAWNILENWYKTTFGMESCFVLERAMPTILTPRTIIRNFALKVSVCDLLCLLCAPAFYSGPSDIHHLALVSGGGTTPIN